MDANKQKIVDRFVNNVLGKKADTSSYNQTLMQKQNQISR
jgi:hypothetical protein